MSILYFFKEIIFLATGENIYTYTITYYNKVSGQIT